MAVVAAVVTGALLAAPSAPAATEVGNSCPGNYGGLGSFTGISSSSDPANPLPLAVPVAGVITQWKTTVALAVPPGFSSKSVQVFRPTGAPNQFQAIASSALAPISTGANVFSTRLPVQAGDRIGSFDSSYTIACKTENPADVLAYIEKSSVPIGTSATFKTVTGYQAAVSVVVEPDADNDGYGDETQDLCPLSAAVQTSCPRVTLGAFTEVGDKAASVFVTTNANAPVQVSGVVKLGKGSTAKLSAKQKTVIPGRVKKFTLRFSGPLQEKLKELGPSEKLTLKITAKATNVVGQVSTDKLKAKLRGQG